MGANQSGQSTGSRNAHQHGITVVNPAPGQSDQQEKIILPPRVPPILSVDGHNIDQKRHPPELQLNHHYWLDFVTTVDKFSNSRATLVAARQSQLQEKIIRLDSHVQKFTDSYVDGKHKALARLNDDCRKMEELDKLLQKCTTQSEICVDMLDKLNFLLPEDLKLEKLEL